MLSTARTHFDFFNRILPMGLLGLALGMVKSYAMKKMCSSSGPSGYHYKAGEKQLLQYKKRGKYST